MRIGVAAVSLLAAAGVTGATAAIGTAAPTASNKTITVKLAGKNEVPKGAPKGSATAKIRLLGKTGKVCWTFTKITGFTKPTAAHIHKAKTGKAGPILVPFGGAFKRSGCVSAPAATIAAIQKSPKSYYVNIHNAKYPGGAVRGQL
ncbi:MAG: hypothetical protein JWN32_2369 [Solirubrobacterales bacterium]|nr:hypothetical protein [Solirubrobacterales bacterium]